MAGAVTSSGTAPSEAPRTVSPPACSPTTNDTASGRFGPPVTPTSTSALPPATSGTGTSPAASTHAPPGRGWTSTVTGRRGATVKLAEIAACSTVATTV